MWQGAQPPAARRLDIQGLRAVAVALVVAFHAGLPVPGGFIGVDLFLVVSGFVITDTLLRELERAGTIRLGVFYARRIKRLLPALALLTTAVAVLAVFFGSPFGSQQTAARTGLGATFFSANLVLLSEGNPYWDVGSWTNPLLHTWTLSVEEQVYLVFPALLLGSWVLGRTWLRTSRRTIAVMLLTLTTASFLVSVLASFGRGGHLLQNPAMFAFYSPFSRVWEFAVGAAVALAAPALRQMPSPIAVLTGLAGACAIAAGAATLTGVTPYPGLAVLLPVFGAAAAIVAGFGPPAGVARLLAAAPLVWIGDLSYAWYLWHWPLLVFGLSLWPASPSVLVVIGVLSLIPAWLSTTFLENPIRGRAMTGRRVAGLVALCTVVPALLCTGLALGARAAWGNAAIAQMQAQVLAEQVSSAHGCEDPVLPPRPACGWNMSASGPPVYLVGDSTAGQYGTALIGATSMAGRALTIHTSPGCDFGLTSCDGYVPSTVEWLSHQAAGMVVIASVWDGLGDAGTTSDLRAVVQRIRGAGHEVVLVMPTPYFLDRRLGEWLPQRCPNVVAVFDTERCGATVPESQARADRSAVAGALTTVAGITGATTLDLFEYFCSGGVCRTNLGNRWMFHDGAHITVAESASLAPAFATRLRRHAADGG